LANPERGASVTINGQGLLGENVSWLVVINAIGSVQGLFLAAILARSGKNQAANRWLALFLVAYSLIALGDVLEQSGLLRNWPHFSNTADPLLFLLGPLLWRYVVTLTQPNERTRNFLWHSLPAFLLVLYLLPFYRVDQASKLALLEAEWARVDTDMLGNPVVWLLIAQIGIYVMLIGAQIRRYRIQLGDFFSKVERRRLGWLTGTLLAGLALFLVWLLWLVTQKPWAKTLDALGFPVVVYLFGYLGLRQPQLFLPWANSQLVGDATLLAEAVPKVQPPPSAVNAETPKYSKSILAPELALTYREKMEQYFVLEKPYLENDLTLADLAQRLDMSGHHLSQMLNVHFGKSFFDVINEHRVREVQRCLADPQYAQQTILELALASGFSSKAAFNSAFKKISGTTPSQYRRMHSTGMN
jgi:AraC-like DNA-binding protein